MICNGQFTYVAKEVYWTSYTLLLVLEDSIWAGFWTNVSQSVVVIIVVIKCVLQGTFYRSLVLFSCVKELSLSPQSCSTPLSSCNSMSSLDAVISAIASQKSEAIFYWASNQWMRNTTLTSKLYNPNKIYIHTTFGHVGYCLVSHGPFFRYFETILDFHGSGFLLRMAR